MTQLIKENQHGKLLKMLKVALFFFEIEQQPKLNQPKKNPRSGRRTIMRCFQLKKLKTIILIRRKKLLFLELLRKKVLLGLMNLHRHHKVTYEMVRRQL